jgi:hypothetical protein
MVKSASGDCHGSQDLRTRIGGLNLHDDGNFLFCNSFYSFWLCAFVMLLGHYVVADAEYIWYFLDINIYSLSKK